MNTRVGKLNLRGSKKKNEHEDLRIELNCICGWQLEPLMKKVMNGSVHDDKVY